MRVVASSGAPTPNVKESGAEKHECSCVLFTGTRIQSMGGANTLCIGTHTYIHVTGTDLQPTPVSEGRSRLQP
jgi:hypothetical protein